MLKLKNCPQGCHFFVRVKSEDISREFSDVCEGKKDLKDFDILPKLKRFEGDKTACGNSIFVDLILKQ